MRQVLLLFLLLATALQAQKLPTRIISLVPAATEMLFAIGAGPRVVAVSSFDREPAEVRTLPNVGAIARELANDRVPREWKGTGRQCAAYVAARRGATPYRCVA